jgi:alanine dehydrogenase
MSRVAGRIAVRLGARALTGADDADLADVEVVVIGAGAAGGAAVHEAARRRGRTSVFAASSRRFAALAGATPAPLTMEVFDPVRLRAALPTTRLLIGAVLVAGRTSPRLIDRAMIASMPPGAVFIDIGIDQRGIAETSRMTSLADPFFTVDGVIHCGVPNLPALEPRAATEGYAAAVLPYVVDLAARGIDAIVPGSGLARGIQIRRGALVDPRLALDTQRRPKAVSN